MYTLLKSNVYHPFLLLKTVQEIGVNPIESINFGTKLAIEWHVHRFSLVIPGVFPSHHLENHPFPGHLHLRRCAVLGAARVAALPPALLELSPELLLCGLQLRLGSGEMGTIWRNMRQDMGPHMVWEFHGISPDFHCYFFLGPETDRIFFTWFHQIWDLTLPKN